MESSMTVNGGSVTLRGVLATLFGIAAVFWPGLTLKTFIYLFSAFILVNGLIDLVAGIGHVLDTKKSILARVFTLLGGLLEIGVGVYLLRHPQVTFATLILLIGFVLIIRGVFEVVGGLFEDTPGSHRILLVIVGLLTVLAGIVVLFQPVSAGVAFVWIIGLYALITGPLLIALGFEMNKQNKLVR